MFTIPVVVRHICRLTVFLTVVLATSLTASGFAAAVPAGSAQVGSQRVDPVEVSLSTGAWALFGVVLLVWGLVSASRSGRRVASPACGASGSGLQSSTGVGGVDMPDRQIRVADSHVAPFADVSSV